MTFCRQGRRSITFIYASSCICATHFFFSSRRRHTRFSRAWSSDVCSSDLLERREVELPLHWGTMIELARASVVAGEIAEVADFFSFGTNDLTQTAWGFSRDDIGKFLAMYEERKLVSGNPFVTIDRPGVGRLMQMAVGAGKAVKPDLHLGICGEQGGDPTSVVFCHEILLDYVSCSPFRIETARLAAGQAALGTAEAASK